MRFNTLDAWLDWQQTLNPKAIDLGLQRVRQVYDRLDIKQIAQKVITVAGTNGKGSTVAYYETWFKNNGIKVASYTSPHLLRYNERIKFNGEAVSDLMLCEAFDIIDRARQDITLTYFEFGTLAAFYLISQYNPEVAVLEVGLGGRLDAVNIIDADLAHITPIGLDHQEWLGKDRNSIAREKAGILRESGLSVVNDAEPPESLLQELEHLHCRCVFSSRDYRYQQLDNGLMQWQLADYSLQLKSVLPGEHQAHNLSGVLAGLYHLGYLQEMPKHKINESFNGLRCIGRLQQIDSRLPGRLWVDVGHNEDAAQALTQYFTQSKQSARLIVLLGMLGDKKVENFVQALNQVVDEWWLLGLDCDRGLSAEQLGERVAGLIPVSQQFKDVEAALKHAVLSLNNQDILLATGSFMTVEAVVKSSV